jgi:hypothetical protein
MSFPEPYQVAKIAALLRNHEGWYETIDEAHTLLLKAEEYCRDYRIKNPNKITLPIYLAECSVLPKRMKLKDRMERFHEWMGYIVERNELRDGANYIDDTNERYAEWMNDYISRDEQEAFETWHTLKQKEKKVEEGSKAHEKKD